MNEIVLQMKQMRRAMRVYVLMLYEIVLESKPDLILEIGVGQAQSTRTFLSALKENGKGKLVSIDLRDRTNRVPEELRPYWHLVVGNSHSKEVFEKVKQFGQYELLLIDGDHSYKGVKKDFEMYVPLVKDRGLILMHDTVNIREGVRDFWKEIRYPKVNLEYGSTIYGKGHLIPGMGIIQKI
ncbi:MAG: class I SAM-dependent methyltransferase [Candidatus Hodarchaeales archaeon]